MLRILARLEAFARPSNDDWDFLNRAQNRVDLERRIQIVTNPERWQRRH